MLDKHISDLALAWALMEEEGDLADETVVVKLPKKMQRMKKITVTEITAVENI